MTHQTNGHTCVTLFPLQNSDLVTRVDDISVTCGGGATGAECDGACLWNGRMYALDETWAPDMCTVCICQVGSASPCNIYISLLFSQ